MNYGTLLFSPNGEAGPRPFMIGIAIVAALLFLVKASAAISLSIGSILSIVGLALIWCWFAVFAKRFRYSGRSAGWAVIPVLVIVLVGAFVIDGIVQNMVAPDLMEEMAVALQDAVANDGLMASVGIAQEYAGPVAEATALPVGVARAAFAIVIAGIVNAMLGDNRTA